MTEKKGFERLFFNISSLVDLGQEVTSSKELDEKMKSALYVVTGIFSVPRAALFSYNSNKRRLELLASKGIKDTKAITLEIKSQDIKAFSGNGAYNLCDLEEKSLYKDNSDIFKRLQTTIFIPLYVKDEFVGAITLGKRLSRASYLKTEKAVLKVVASHMAIALHNANLFNTLINKVNENKRLYENMRHIYHETIQAFAAAIDAKDVYTKDHSFRVAKYAVAMAKELGWGEKELEGLYVAGLLHDIGKLIIDNKVINKGEGLTDMEFCEIKKHPQVSYDILSKIKLPWKNAAYFVKHHHERVDGLGYPSALKESELCDGTKILALADAFDAMTSDRPYRFKKTLPEAINEIMECLGTQFDNRISRILFKVLYKELAGEAQETQIVPLLNQDYDRESVTDYLRGLITEL